MKNKFVINKLQLTSAVTLTLADRRLFNYLLLNAYEEIKKQKVFKIYFRDLQGIYGSGLPPLERLKTSISRLTHTVIEIETSSNSWLMTNLLNQVELNQTDQALSYSFSSLCSQLLSDSITLEKCLIQAHFTHKYSNALYDLLAAAHYSNQPSYMIDVSDLRDRLQVSIEKFKNFGDFNRFVLTPALNEINSYASFATKFQMIRKGMKITHVVFNMTNKRNISLNQAKKIIPPKRPQLFIENPEVEQLYAYLLNAETNERRKYFNLARKKAAQKNEDIIEDAFDTPDIWFKWIMAEIKK